MGIRRNADWLLPAAMRLSALSVVTLPLSVLLGQMTRESSCHLLPSGRPGDAYSPWSGLKDLAQPTPTIIVRPVVHLANSKWSIR